MKVQLRPEKILIRKTNGTGICIAIIHFLENLCELPRIYPNGRLIKNTSNIISFIDMVFVPILFYNLSFLIFVIPYLCSLWLWLYQKLFMLVILLWCK
jgi:hypothetical protein